MSKEANKLYCKKYGMTFKGKFASYKSCAKARGHSFDLTEKEFETFWQKDCSYCGGGIASVGIDRIDSSVGYQIDNVVSCCSVCNLMKLDHNKQAWLDKMYTILKHQGII